MFDSSSSHIDFQSSQSKNSTHMFTYLTPLKKPRMEISSQIETTKSQKQYMVGCEYQKTGKVNFSNFSVPAVFLKSTHQQNSSRNDVSSTKFQEQKPNKSSMELLPTVDEHSEAASASHNTAFDIRQKRKASAIDLCNERGSSSVCSLEASNDPNYGLRKLHEETDDSPYFSDVS
jgi:phytochrome-interacting factor 3